MARRTSNQTKPFCNNCKDRHDGRCTKAPFCNTCKTNHTGNCPAKPLCSSCQKYHYGPCTKKNQTNNNNNSNNSNNNSKAQNQTTACDYCKKPAHVAKDCLQRIADEKRKKSVGDVSMLGMDAAVHYCPVCNSSGHVPASCPNRTQENLAGIFESPLTCWRCKHRGHVAADCRKSTEPGCVVCRTLTHNTEDCKVATLGHKRLARHNQRERLATSTEVFRSSSASTLFEREAAKVHAARRGANVVGTNLNIFDDRSRRPAFSAPHPYLDRLNTSGEDLYKYPQSQALSPSALNLKTPTHLSHGERAIFQANKARQLRQRRSEMDLEIDKKIDLAHMTYHKQHISHYFTDQGIRQFMLEKKYLSKTRLDEAGQAVIDLRAHFFRDPKTLEAIARHMIPECRTCHKLGDICDRYLNPVPTSQDVFTVEDGDIWGITIAMHCQCCLSNGYDFVPRIEFDAEGRPTIAAAQLTPRRLYPLLKWLSR